VVVNEAPLQLAGRPISYRLHVLWLPQLANGPASFVHSVGLPDAFTSHPVELSSLEPVGIAAAAWGNGRIDAIVTDRHADGDLTHIAAVEHVWSDDHGETFGSETLSIG
jgi:hypothetical protein